jgi:hypothetical protein
VRSTRSASSSRRTRSAGDHRVADPRARGACPTRGFAALRCSRARQHGDRDTARPHQRACRTAWDRPRARATRHTADGCAARDRVLHAVVGRLARRAPSRAARGGPGAGEHRPRRAVAHAPLAQLVEDVRDEVCRHPPLARSARHDEWLVAVPTCDPTPPGRKQLSHPRIPFEDSGVRGVGPTRGPCRRPGRPRSCAWTSTSPSAGSTAPMWSRKARLGPTTSTPARDSRSRWA